MKIWIKIVLCIVVLAALAMLGSRPVDLPGAADVVLQMARGSAR